MDDRQRTIAYFSMEIAVASDIPTYSGGLGVLAGDTLRSAADLALPVVGVTLAHRGGYFRQSIDSAGAQTEAPANWDPADRLEPLPERAEVEIEGRTVAIAAWRFIARGHGGATVPVLLLDTDLPENTDEDRRLTDRLYGGDDAHRLRQEIVLGIGGVRLLEANGFAHVEQYHMNEGHAALLVLELTRREAERTGLALDDDRVANTVRNRCVFTTHTPVPAGHDTFTEDLAKQILGADAVEPFLPKPEHEPEPKAKPADKKRPQKQPSVSCELNMTHLALGHSRAVNAVARRHAEVSRKMFPGHEIHAITNGVHARTWVGPEMAALFDEHLPAWRDDPSTLLQAAGLPLEAIRAAHARAKARLLESVAELAGVDLNPEALTITFARRATAYKRADLVLSDPDRLVRIAKEIGPIQFVYGGKAHPKDEAGKALIERVHEAAGAVAGDVPIAYVPNYEMDACGLMVAGSDVWLNTPLPPLEASGTSGMKAAMNGVPSLSTIDGWWVEGHVEGVTGWGIGSDRFDPETYSPGADDAEAARTRHTESLYEKLETAVAPMFHNEPDAYDAVRRNAIALNGAHFHTHRMMSEYAARIYTARANTAQANTAQEGARG